MANRRSALKRIRTSEKRHERNQAVKSATRTYVKKARSAITGRAEEASTDLVAAISALDRAAKKGVIHRNNAARRKSRLMKLFNVTQQPVEAPEAPTKPAKASRSTKATGARRKAAK